MRLEDGGAAAPGQGPTCGLLLVSPEDLQLLLQVPDVKQFAEVVSGGRQQPVAVQVPLHLHHRVLVGVSERTTRVGSLQGSEGRWEQR